MRLDILKAAIVKLLHDDAATVAEVAERIYQNSAPPPASADADIPTSVVIELSSWPGEDETLSGPLPRTESFFRLIVDGTDVWSVNRAVSAMRTLFHMTEHDVTVASFGQTVAQTTVTGVNDADPGIFGYFQTVLEVSFFWRTTPE